MVRMMTPPGAAPDTDTEVPGQDQTAPGGADTDLDTPATANAPQASNHDADTYATMLAGLRKYIFGPGEKGIVSALMHADDRGRVLGELVFSLMQEAGKQAKMAGRELDMDILLGV